MSTAPLDITNPWRRYFQTRSPGLHRKLFVKRSTEPGECPDLDRLGQAFPDGRPKETLINEARAIEYVRKHTSIPVPATIAAFEDRGVFYLIQEHLTGIPADHAPPSAHPYIVEQLEGYVKQLQSLRSDTVRSFVKGHLFTPARLEGGNKEFLDKAKFKTVKEGYVLCHGDLGWHNFYVDPKSWKITAIFDWEFAGFYPPGMEGEYWRREGPACAAKRGDRPDPTEVVQAMYDSRLPLGQTGDDDDSASTIHNSERSSMEEENVSSPTKSMWEGVEPKSRPVNLTPLQRRLEQLDLDYPEDLPVTHRTLCTQRAILTRSSIAGSLKAIGADMAEDATATASWVSATGDLDPVPISSKNPGTIRPLHYGELT